MTNLQRELQHCYITEKEIHTKEALKLKVRIRLGPKFHNPVRLYTSLKSGPYEVAPIKHLACISVCVSPRLHNQLQVAFSDFSPLQRNSLWSMICCDFLR